MPPAAPRYLLLAEILRPHGVRGEMRVRVLTDYPERMAQLKQVYVGHGPDDPNVRGYDVAGLRVQPGGFALLRLDSITTPEAVDRLRGSMVMVALADAVPLEAGEFYLYQLIGLQVRTADGETIGAITEVLETGANDVYVVNGGAYGEVLIPAIPSVVLTTDITAGVVTVALPEGLLPTPDTPTQSNTDA